MADISLKGRRVRLLRTGEVGTVVKEYPGMFWADVVGYVAHHIDVRFPRRTAHGLEDRDVEVLPEPDSVRAALRLVALVKRDLDMIRRVTLPGPGAHLGFQFPVEIWTEALRERLGRCKTDVGRRRLEALAIALGCRL